MILLPHRMPALASPGKHPIASNAKTSLAVGRDCLKPDAMETI
jgi:hypothetical protein